MLRLAAAVGLVAFAVTEGLAFALTRQFPPSQTTHLVAGLLAIALAYSSAATLFAGELIRAALRAVRLLQGEAEARCEEAGLVAEPRTGSAGSTQVTPLPLPARQSSPLFAASAPGVQTSLPLAPGAAPASVPAYGAATSRPRGATSLPLSPLSSSLSPVQPIAPLEEDPTLPVTIYEEDSATVLLLPELGPYGGMPFGAPAQPAMQPWPGATEAANMPGTAVPPPLPERYALYRRYAPVASLQSIEPLHAIEPIAPIAPIAPLPLAPAAVLEPVAAGVGDAARPAARRGVRLGWGRRGRH